MKSQQITLDRLELYLLDLPQKRAFKSGIGTRKSKETLIIKWVDKEGRAGYGECSCRPDPYYSAEFLAAAMLLVENFIAPKLQTVQTYHDVLGVLRQIRGWNFTKSAVEAAVFQILSNQRPPTLLAEALKSERTSKVPVGISLGIYEDKIQFHDIVQEALAEGYQRLKFKISPTVKTEVFDHVNPVLFEHQAKISFDANGSFYGDGLEKMEYFVETYNCPIEQPTPPSRFDLLLRAKALFPKLRVCFDEEVKSIGDVVKLKSLDVIDELNLKVGRVGGYHNSIQIMNYCYEQEIPCWMGGMFETGIGRLQNLAFASFLPNATAHDLSPSSRYFKEDIITPEITMTNGFIDPEAINTAQVMMERINKYTTKKVVIKK